MNSVFMDTFAVVALVNRLDPWHSIVSQYIMSLRNTKIITTEWVLLESANSLSKPSVRNAFVGFQDTFRKSPIVDIENYDRNIFESGFNLFSTRPDKDWSLTDCISFAVMADRGIADALTADHHYTQAGFNAVFTNKN